MYTCNDLSTRLKAPPPAFKLSDGSVSRKLRTAAAMAESQSSANEKGQGSKNQSSSLEHYKRCFQSGQTPSKTPIRLSTSCTSVGDVFLYSKIFTGSEQREAEDEPPSGSSDNGRLRGTVLSSWNTPSSSVWFRRYLPDCCWRGHDVFDTSLQGCHACDLWEKFTSGALSKILKATKCLL